MALPVLLISLFTYETVPNILLHGKVDEKELEFALTLVRLLINESLVLAQRFQKNDTAQQ